MIARCVCSSWNRAPLLRLFVVVLLLVTSSVTSAAQAAAPGGDASAETPAPFPGRLITTRFPGGNFTLAGSHTLFSFSTKSDDGGRTWLDFFTPSSTLAASPAFDSDHKLFAGLDRSSDDAFWLSDDGGRTWRSSAQPLTGPISMVVVSASFVTDHTVYALHGSGSVSSSTDGGERWAALPAPGGEAVTDLVLSPPPTAGRVLYATTEGGHKLWRWTAGGNTWDRIDAGLFLAAGNGILALATARVSGQQPALFVATEWGLVVTFDDGKTWYLVHDAVFVSLVVADGPVIFGREKGTDRLLRSIDWGESWQDALPGLYLRRIALSPAFSRDGTVYAATEWALHASHDGGVSWEVVSEKYDLQNGEVVRGIVPSPAYPSDRTIFTYSRMAAARSTDGGFRWTRLTLPEPVDDGLALALSPSFAGDRTVLMSLDGQLYKSADAGEHWAAVGGQLPFDPWAGFKLLRLSPVYPSDRTIFAGAHNRPVYRSTDGGLNWSALPGLPATVTDLEVSPGYATDHTLFVDAWSAFYRSEDGGASWTEIPRPENMPGYDLQLSPAYPQDHTLFAAEWNLDEGGFYRSDDRGNSWVRLGAGLLAGYCEVLAISPGFAKDGVLVAATHAGPLYISEDRGDTWRPLRGLSYIGNYRRSGAAVVYEDGLVMPFITDWTGFYRLRWPTLTALPLQPFIALSPDNPQPRSIPFALVSDDTEAAAWEVSESAGWLTASPGSGQGAVRTTLTADPAQVTGWMRTELGVRVEWSTSQVVTRTVTVEAALVKPTWLPLVARGTLLSGAVMESGWHQPSWYARASGK